MRHRVQLLCLPHAGGSASSYRSWMAGASTYVDVLPVQLPGREGRYREPFATDLRRLVEDLLDAVESASFHEVALFGHSLGAVIATKLCQALESARIPVRHLFVSGHPGPLDPGVRTGVRDVTHANEDVIVQTLAGLDRALADRLADPDVRALLLPILRSDIQLDRSGRIGGERLRTPVTVLAGAGDPVVAGLDLARWASVTSAGCEIRLLPGDHFYLATQGAAVASIIGERLAARPVRPAPVAYDPYDPVVHADPYAAYARLRESAPVYRSDEHDFWALSRHRDVAPALGDSRRFSNANGILIGPFEWGPNAHRYQSLLAMDPPQHTQVRTMVGARFTRRRVGALEPLVRHVVDACLEPAVQRGTFDFIEDFAARLPTDVLSAVIGVPEVDRAEVGRLSRAAAQHGHLGRDLPAASIEAALALTGYYSGLVAERRRRRRDDLVSELLDASTAGHRMTDEQIVAFLNTLTGAANDTVVHLLGSAWYSAWRNPSQAAIAFAGDVEAWIEETLRFDTPTQFVARTSTVELELHGTRVPAGSRLLLLIGSANRDGDAFPAPDRYDLRRRTRRSLSFGQGRHRCLGVDLARLEARVALGALVARVADYEIDEAGIVRAAAAEIRGFAHLPTAVKVR